MGKEKQCKVACVDSATDIQIGGNHYNEMSIQPIDFIMANNLSFCQGNVIKYICRYKNKNGIEDLKKIKHYVDFLIEEENKHLNQF